MFKSELNSVDQLKPLPQLELKLTPPKGKVDPFETLISISRNLVVFQQTRTKLCLC